MTNIIQKSQNKIDKICQDAGISYLALFGSQARGDERIDSDIDLLVEFKKTPGLISFIHTKQQFESVFDRKVDLVTKNGLSKYLKPYIQNDLQQIYG
ncbi:nucleotidyltransferase family protein [Patescibacteria group bacterium]|nr:nucleotidyltransferase family protein [Patescibacteria group bacterium]